MMTCEEALEAISAALDGELPAHDRRELDAHLRVCPACDALFHELAAQSQALRELDCEAPEGLDKRILARLPRWRTTPAFWRQAGTVAVCLTLVLCLGAMARGWAASNAAADADAAVDMGDMSRSVPEAQAEPYGGSAPDPAPQEEAPGDEPYSSKASVQMTLSSPAPAETGVHYLSAAWSQAPAARCLTSADELRDCLEQYGPDSLAEMTAEYGEDYFETAALLAVPYDGGGTGEELVLDVEAGEDSYSIVLRPDGSAEADSALNTEGSWLILVETEKPPEDARPVIELKAVSEAGDT